MQGLISAEVVLPLRIIGWASGKNAKGSGLFRIVRSLTALTTPMISRTSPLTVTCFADWVLIGPVSLGHHLVDDYHFGGIGSILRGEVAPA